MALRTLVICLLLIWAGAPVAAQKPTRRGPANVTELITLLKDTPFDQALRVIRALSSQIIVDPQHLTEPIGVDVDRQPWLFALVQIAKSNRLYVVEREGYYELLPEDEDVPVGERRAAETTLDSREVNISAVFFQADRSAIRELGVDWTTLNGGKVSVRGSQGGARMVSGDLFSLGIRTSIGKSVSVDALLKTFEMNNSGEVVANPQVKVQSGKTGYIQVGSDFSVTTSDFAGNAITQFFSTGTILTVKPRILREDQIDFVDLEVEAERSSLVDPVRNLISKTVARTSTLLRDGEQTAIGGLYGQEASHSRVGIPLLKDLPRWFFGLRYLFGYNSKQVAKTELVVLLKVDIVPSVRQRAEQRREEEKTSRIVQEGREAFEDVLKQLRERSSP